MWQGMFPNGSNPDHFSWQTVSKYNRSGVLGARKLSRGPGIKKNRSGALGARKTDQGPREQVLHVRGPGSKKYRS